jgi:hypothetical protein
MKKRFRLLVIEHNTRKMDVSYPSAACICFYALVLLSVDLTPPVNRLSHRGGPGGGEGVIGQTKLLIHRV